MKTENKKGFEIGFLITLKPITKKGLILKDYEIINKLQ